MVNLNLDNVFKWTLSFFTPHRTLYHIQTEFRVKVRCGPIEFLSPNVKVWTEGHRKM